MQPEETLDQTAPAQTAPPAQEPAGLTRRKQLHALLVQEKFDVPEDFATFEAKIDEKPERLQKLHETLVADKFDVPTDFTIFEQKLAEGLKKKDQASATVIGNASSLGSPAGGTISPSPNSAPPNSPGGIGAPTTSISVTNPALAAVLDPVQVAGAAEPTTISPRAAQQYTPGDEYIDAGLPLPSGEELRTKEEARQRAKADLEDDGFFTTLGKQLTNLPATVENAAGNTVDFFGDMAEMMARAGVVGTPYGTGVETRPGGLASAEEIASPLTEDKPSDVLGKKLRDDAVTRTTAVSKRAQESVLKDPTNTAAWGNLLGQTANSIAAISAASAVGGPVAGVTAGSALGISSTKDAAREAGISDKEAAITAAVLAPVQGILEETGLGFIMKNAAARKVLQSEIVKRALAYGEGKILKAGVVKAASEVLPDVVKRYGSRAIIGGLGEAGTEVAQGEAEGVAKLAADALRDPALPGYGISVKDALVMNPLEQGVGGFAGGGLAGAGARFVQGVDPSDPAPAAAPGAAYPTEGPTFSRPAVDGQEAIEGARVVGHFLSPQGEETYRVVTPQGAVHEVPVAGLQMDEAPAAAPPDVEPTTAPELTGTDVGQSPAAAAPQQQATTPQQEAATPQQEPAEPRDGTPTPFPKEKQAALERLERARTRLVEAKAAAAKKPNITLSTIVPLPTVDTDVVKAYLELGAAHIANGIVNVKALVAKLRDDDPDATGLSTNDAEREAQLTTLARHALAAEGQASDLPSYNPNRPAAHRAAGGFVRDGAVVERQAPVPAERLAVGKKTSVQFSGKDKASARYAVMEAADVQPSHRKGSENENHFLPEAQPKERGADVSKDSEASIRQIADAPDVARLGQSDNAYFGAPVVNSRGEVVQGNGRSEGVRRHYEDAADGGEKFRTDTAALAAEVGISPDELGKFRNPVVVRMLDVADNEAVRLGNYDVKDLESGGEQRVDPKATANRMDAATKSRLTQILGDNSENIQTLTGLIKARGGQLVDLLSRKGLLSQTQRATVLDAAGNLNSDGVKAMRGVLRELVIGGNKRLSTFYSRLPAPVRGGIDRALLHIAAGEGDADFRDDLRSVLGAMRERAAWMKKSGGTAKDWMSTPELFGDRQQTPAERMSPTEKALLGLLDRNSKGNGSAREVYEALRNFAEATQGRPGDMFNAEVPGVAKADAVGYLAKPKGERTRGKADAVQARTDLSDQLEKQRTTIRERVDALEDERQQTKGKEFTSLPAELVKSYADLGALLLREKAMSLRQFAARLREEHEKLGLTASLTDREIKRTFNQSVRQLETALGEKAKFTRARLKTEISELKQQLNEVRRSTVSKAEATARATSARNAERAARRGDVKAQQQQGDIAQREAVAAAQAQARGDAAIEAQRQRENNAAKDARHRGDMLVEKQRAATEKARLQAQATAYRDAVTLQRKAVTDWLTANRSRFAGHVKGKEMASILRRVNAATTSAAVSKALDYAENVLAKKEYAAQIADAERLRRQVKKSSTTDQGNRQVTASDRALLADFAKLDPNEVEDLGAYTNLAKQLLQGTKNAATVVDAAGERQKSAGRAVSQADARAYVAGELARMEAQRQQDLLDTWGHLKDAQGNPLLKAGTTAAEMSALVNEAMQLSPDELQQAKDDAAALAADKRIVLESAAMQMQTDAFLGNHLLGLPADIHDALLYVNPADFSDKVLARFIGVLDNIMTNGNTDGAGDVVAEAQAAQVAAQLPGELAKAGLVPSDISAMLKGDLSSLSPNARKLVGTRVAAKKLKGGAIRGAISLDLVVELISGNIKQAARVQRRIGLSDLSEGYTRATKSQEKVMRGFSDLLKSFGKAGEKSARTALNVYRRGVLAHAVQHLGGSEAERRAHFTQVKQEVKLTYERYQESPGLVNKETGRLIKQAYDELLATATTGDEALANMVALPGQDGANNAAVVSYFQRAFADKVDALDNNLRLYHNQALDRFENYTATSKVMLDKSGLATAGDEAAADLTDSAFQPRAVGTKQSATTLTRKGGLRKGQVLDLDFDNVQSRKYFESQYDVETNGARRLFNSALRRPELQAAFGGEENAGVLYDRVKGQVDAQRGIGSGGNEAVSVGMRLFDVVARKGTRLALLGVTQLPKQYVSVAVNTMATLGKNAGLYFKAAGMLATQSKELRTFLAQYPIALREQTEAGLNRDVRYDRVQRADVLAGGEGGWLRRQGSAAADVFEKAAEVVAKPLVFSDVSVAQTSWVAFYLESLKDAGVNVQGAQAADLGQLGSESQRADAASYAEQKVSRAQNVNDKTKAAPLWQESGGGWGKVARSMILPFSQFSVNQRARLLIDASNAVRGGARAEGSRLALAATTAEMVTFNAIKAAVLAPLMAAGTAAILGALGNEPGEPPEPDQSAVEKTFGLVLQDMFFSGMGSVVQSKGTQAVNATYAALQTPEPGQRPKQLIPEISSNPNQRDFSDLGVYGVLAQKLYMMGEALPYLDGQTERILNARTSDTETVDLTPAEKRTMYATLILNTIMLAGASDADLSRLADRVERTEIKEMKAKYGDPERWQKRRIAGKGEVSNEQEAAAADNRAVVKKQAENNVALAGLAKQVAAASDRTAARKEAHDQIETLAAGDKREKHRLTQALVNQVRVATRFKEAPAYIIELHGLNTRKEQGFYLKHKLEGKSAEEKAVIMEEVKKYRLLSPIVREVLK